MIYMNHKENIIMTKSGNKLIAHRGNTTGKTKHENDPEYVIDALDQGYDVEVDVSYRDGNFWLGHDKSKHRVNLDFLRDNRIWCHLKNKESLKQIVDVIDSKEINYFWHTSEDFVITSKGFLWHHSKSPLSDLTCKSIIVLPEGKRIFPRRNKLYNKINHCYGICSDYIKMYV